MSWSAQFRAKDLELTPKGEPSNVEVPYHQDQYKAAQRVALSLIRSGKFGDKNGLYDVVLSGHGNEGHVPAEGWADDYVSVTVYQRREDSE